MESLDEIIKQVTEFTDKAHGEQTRKYTPDRYIVHPVRVMEICRKITDDIAVLSAALMHDVLEDTPVRKSEIKDFLLTLMDTNTAEKTVRLVVELTDVYVKADYPKMNRRTRKSKEAARMEQTSAEAQTIKYADIIDNCREIVNHDRDFAKVFLNECRALLRRMNKGDKNLYKEAVDMVDMNLARLKKKREED